MKLSLLFRVEVRRGSQVVAAYHERLFDSLERDILAWYWGRKGCRIVATIAGAELPPEAVEDVPEAA